MKYIKIYLLLLLSFHGKARDTTITFTPATINKQGYIALGDIDTGTFRRGNDRHIWANNSIDNSSWQKLKPTRVY